MVHFECMNIKELGVAFQLGVRRSQGVVNGPSGAATSWNSGTAILGTNVICIFKKRILCKCRVANTLRLY